MISRNKSFKIGYRTKKGAIFCGLAEDVLSSLYKKYRGKLQLIFTSPPFPLNRKKRYGNERGEAYVKWLSDFAPLFRSLLRRNGSIVIELGNAWEPGRPVMSTLALRALLAFLDKGRLNLCQQFVCYNKARLPGPAQWVNVERIRVKDAYTHIWWMSPSDRPKASNRRVLKEYSAAMLRLLTSKKYNAGRRPSEHHIGATSFLRKHRGAIPPNLIVVSNTASADPYQKYCREHKLPIHPARMPTELPAFFINFLTTSRDIVLDPFAGSNTTGAVAEKLNRKWIAIESNQNYVKGSWGRFAARAPKQSRGVSKRPSHS